MHVTRILVRTGAARGRGGHAPPEIGFTKKFLAAPLRTNRQIYRDNYPAECPEEYFKVALSIPYIDDRFWPHGRICVKMQSLIPNFIKQANFNDLSEVLEL